MFQGSKRVPRSVQVRVPVGFWKDTTRFCKDTIKILEGFYEDVGFPAILAHGGIGNREISILAGGF